MTQQIFDNTWRANGRDPLWTRPFVFLMLQNLLFWVAMNMFTTILPGYVLTIGGTAAQTGVLVGLFPMLRCCSGLSVAYCSIAGIAATCFWLGRCWRPLFRLSILS